MARRSDHTREELKELAIAAGQRIIVNEGFNKFSARKVAKEIGYTVGTLYNIFGDYNDIVLHINSVTLDDMASYIRDYINEKSEGKKALRQLGSSYLDFAKEHFNRWQALFEHTIPPDKELPEWYGEKIRVLFSLVEKPLISILDNNQEKAEKAARVLWASIHGICILGLSGKLDIVGAASVQKMMDSFIDIYFTGIKNH